MRNPLCVWLWLAVFIPIVITGCGDKMSPIPLEVAQQIPETTKELSTQNTKRLGFITDASVAKEMIANNGYVQSLLGYFKALENSGTSIKMKLVNRSISIDGKVFTWTEPMVDEVKHTPAPSTAWFSTLSKDPSIHPGWKTTENIFGAAFKFGTIMFGIDRVTGMVTELASQASYYFNNSPVNQGFNNAGNDQTFKGIPFKNDIEEGGVDALGNPCTGETPIEYNGTCYSEQSVIDRGFPIGE